MPLDRPMTEVAPYDRGRGHAHRSARRTDTGLQQAAASVDPLTRYSHAGGRPTFAPLLKILGDKEADTLSACWPGPSTPSRTTAFCEAFDVASSPSG